ncbi:hypothetical protein PISMIDRAFT_353304 [Pisolithus microcarpus 441]|uniref:Uncharacterized protein n=1 Tax=Pisolithus microcarpus 441 TaxID=765257 RepID=A0A0C9ZZD0_9AGAM|nr:hypothetical protein PISMIDRAFT_353304 [Pisolithus microcarpus 441]
MFPRFHNSRCIAENAYSISTNGARVRRMIRQLYSLLGSLISTFKFLQVPHYRQIFRSYNCLQRGVHRAARPILVVCCTRHPLLSYRSAKTISTRLFVQCLELDVHSKLTCSAPTHPHSSARPLSRALASGRKTYRFLPKF